MFVQIWLAFFVALAQGYTTFTTTCKTPEATVNFVSSPNARGSLDILWSCLFTILACTWNVLYLNVREQRNGRDPGLLANMKWLCKDFWPSLKWMVITIFAPEVLLAKNMADLKDAWFDQREIEHYAIEDDVPWTLAHSMFANMGGFVIRGPTERYLVKEEKENPGKSETEAEDLEGARAEKQVRFDLELAIDTSTNRFPTESTEVTGEVQISKPTTLGGNQSDSPTHPENHPLPFEIRDSGETKERSSPARYTTNKTLLSEQDLPGDRRIVYLIGSDILILRQKGILPRLPFVTMEEIKDKSKTDGFSRAVAMFQILWMAVQTIARKTRGIPMSQLEVAVLAFAACAIIIYGFNADKPKGVGRRPRYSDTRALHDYNYNSSGLTQLIGLFKSIFSGKSRERRLDHPVPNSFSRGRTRIEQESTGNFEGIILGGLVFGAIHLTAWNFTFPTRAEQIVWRVASLWCTVSVLMFWFIYSLPFFSEQLGKPVGAVGMPLTILIIALYILARLFLIVEIFRTLCFLRPETYVTTWASSVVHVG